jgi:hypothetical protein
MLLPIRRPVRPEPLPLRERASSNSGTRNGFVWVSVRHKRSRPALPPSRLSMSVRGRSSALRGA